MPGKVKDAINFFVRKTGKVRISDNLPKVKSKEPVSIKDNKTGSITYVNKELNSSYNFFKNYNSKQNKSLLKPPVDPFSKPFTTVYFKRFTEDDLVPIPIIRPVLNMFKEHTAACPEVVEPILPNLGYLTTNYEKLILGNKSILTSFDHDYYKDHFGHHPINAGVSILKSKDIDAGSVLPSGAVIQFKTSTYFAFHLNSGNSGISFPTERGLRSDFIFTDKNFKSFYFDVKRGRQEVEILNSKNGDELTYPLLYGRSGDPAPKLDSILSILMHDASRRKISNLVPQERYVLLSYDTVVKDSAILKELAAGQKFINTSIIPHLESMYSELSFPKGIYLTFVGATNCLTALENANLNEFNFLVLKENGASYDLTSDPVLLTEKKI